MISSSTLVSDLPAKLDGWSHVMAACRWLSFNISDSHIIPQSQTNAFESSRLTDIYIHIHHRWGHVPPSSVLLGWHPPVEGRQHDKHVSSISVCRPTIEQLVYSMSTPVNDVWGVIILNLLRMKVKWPVRTKMAFVLTSFGLRHRSAWKIFQLSFQFKVQFVIPNT